jgi:VWFA-related protein
MAMCHTKIMRNVLMLLLCAAGFAQQPGTLDPAKADKDKAEKDITFVGGTNVVIAPTTVLDKHGDYINGLQLQDFQLFDNNKLQKITADVHDEPLSLVIAVQKSANLNEILPKIQRVGSMLNDLIAGQDGETAVVAFDHRIVVAQDFTNETQKVTEAMKKLTPGSSNHAVNDAVMEAIRMLKKRPKDRRRVLLLIAEKRDKGSEIRVREVLTEAEFANVAIYSLDISSVMAGLTSTGMPPPPPSIPTTAQHIPAGGALTPTTIDQNYYNGNYIPMFVDIFKAVKSIFVEDIALDVFTRFTGGKEYSFVSERSLEKAVEGISQELHNQYLLSYTPNNQSEGGFHEIKVTVNRPNLEVRTRPGYWVAARPDQ